MVGAHISVSVLETPRTLDSFFPPVDETQPRRWAKALLRRQAAPMPRAARQSSATGRLPGGTLLAVPPPPSSPSTKVAGASRRAWASVVRDLGGSVAPGQFWCFTRILRRLGYPCRTSFPEKLGNFWATSGRIVEEL